MTREEMIRLTGFQVLGEGKRMMGRGFLFGFPVEAMQISKKKLALYFFLGRPPKKQELKILKLRLKETPELKGHVSVTALTLHLHPIAEQTFFSVEIAFKDAEPQALFQKAIQATGLAIKEANITRDPYCMLCQSRAGDALTRQANQLKIVHMACLRQQFDTAEKEVAQKRYIQGVIGGTLGGILALALVLATMYYEALHEFLGLSGIAIPIGIFGGWRLLRGTHNRLTIMFVISSSLILGAISAIANTYRLNFYLFPTDVLWQDVVRACFTPGVLLSEFLTQMIAVVLLTGLGVFSLFHRIFATDKKMMSYVKTSLDEATPLSALLRTDG